MKSPLENKIPVRCLAIYRRIINMIGLIDEYKLERLPLQAELAEAVSRIMDLPLCFGAQSHNINDVFVKLQSDIIVDVCCYDRLPMVQLIRVSPDDIQEHDKNLIVYNNDMIKDLVKIMRQAGYSLAKPR